MLGVVAMFHVGTGKLAEADGHFHFLRRIDIRPDAVHVLARPLFPFWRCLAVAAEDHSFLEVHMHRVAPAIAAVDDFPHFRGAVAAETAVGGLLGQLWRRTDTPWVHAVAKAAIGLDGPWLGIGTVGATEDELAVAGRLELGLVGGRVAVNRQW